MATVTWKGGAVAVAQATTVQITADDASTTYKITIGNITVSVDGSGVDAATTAALLEAALSASTHPYFTAVTWSVVTDTITGTSATAGVPFTFVPSVSGGTGTIGSATEATACTGPNWWSEAANWSGGAVPVSTDDVIIKNSSIPIAWGLDQSAVDLTSLTVEKSFTGTIGLRPDQFATSADAATLDSTAPEYRQVYLDIGSTDIDLGQHLGPGSPAGSARIFIDNDKAGASELRVHSSATAGQGSNPAVAYLAANASADVEVRGAPGGIGIGTLNAGETATLGDVVVSAPDPTTRVFLGGGVTYTNYSQAGGQNRIDAATTVTLITVDGGELAIEGGDYLITTMTINDGTVNDRHDNAGGTIITTLNMNGGEYNALGGGFARTITTCTFKAGTFLTDDDDLTVSSAFIGSAGGRRQVDVQEAN